MTQEEEKEIQKELEARRNELQKTLSEARHQRAELQLKDIDEYRFFLHKVGELSFLLGAAIIPLIIVSGNKEKISYLGFVFAGTILYLIIGLLAFWRSKNIFEKNADGSPLVGLEEEIMVYPVINSHNKLITDLKNNKYIEEFRQASTNLLEWAPKAVESQKPRVSLWLDALLIGFVVASMFVMRAIWPYTVSTYWISCIILLLLILIFTTIGYLRSWKSQVILFNKRQELVKIKSEYQKWHNDTILNPKK